MRRICVVTGSRADYGLLYWIMRELREAPEIELKIVVTGMHLAPEHGLTWQQIEADGFPIAEKIGMLLSDNTPAGVAKSVGLGVIGFADCFARMQPDIAVLLGDRFEILAAAQAGYLASIPLAHIAGGDVTEGALDDGMRHAITKFSTLHFVTNSDAERRVRQLGEDPDRVFLTGSPGIDYVKNAQLIPSETLEMELGIKFLAHNLIITFHPSTTNPEMVEQQFGEVCAALLGLDRENVGLFFTKANADVGGAAINRLIDEFVASRPNARSHHALGPLLYLSLVAASDGVVGNSSSGLYEVPSLNKATVNIGDRQKGRLRALSVIDCPPDRRAIMPALLRVLQGDYQTGTNPYGDGMSAPRIARILREYPLNASHLIKKFHNFVGLPQ